MLIYKLYVPFKSTFYSLIRRIIYKLKVNLTMSDSVEFILHNTYVVFILVYIINRINIDKIWNISLL